MAYEIPLILNVEGCVYKLWYYGKYIIIKCKTLTRSNTIVKETFHRFLMNTPKGRKESDYFHKFFNYVLENPFHSFTIEIIKSSNNPLELLKCEFLELFNSKNDENCLNQNFEVYIPKFTQSSKGKSWINRGYYLNFMKWRDKFIHQNMIE